MSDCEEGDVPLAVRSCACGLAEQEGCAKCPDCGEPWPDKLMTRWPYDGSPEIRSRPKEQ